MIKIKNGFLSLKGVKIGHCHSIEGITGCTVIIFDNPAIYGISIQGSAFSTRQVGLHSADHIVSFANAILITGGSAYGLDATGGVLKFLEEKGVGIKIRKMVVPSVPSAAIYDLGIGNNTIRPDEKMGYNACLNARSGKIEEGSVGAGAGATVGKILGIEKAMKGGIGISEVHSEEGLIVCAISVVNSFGDVVDPLSGEFLAGVQIESRDKKLTPTEFCIIKEGLMQKNLSYGENTTITIIITNAILNRISAGKVAQMGGSAYSICIKPSGTFLDGDIVFTVSTGEKTAEVHKVGILSSIATSESIKRAVTKAEEMGGVPCYKKLKI